MDEPCKTRWVGAGRLQWPELQVYDPGHAISLEVVTPATISTCRASIPNHPGVVQPLTKPHPWVGTRGRQRNQGLTCHAGHKHVKPKQSNVHKPQGGGEKGQHYRGKGSREENPECHGVAN